MNSWVINIDELTSEDSKRIFKAIKEEFDDHLDAINRNTNEIQGNYEFLCELEKKLDKISERLDFIDTKLFGNSDIKKIHLTPKEQEVFLILYSNDSGVSIEELARKLAYTYDLVEDTVDNIVLKGIPVLKQIYNGSIKLHLDLKFKDLQTRENVVGINSSLAKTLVNSSF